MYSLLIIAIACAGINNILLHILSAKKIKYDPLLFNALISFVWVVGLFFYNLGWRSYTSQTLFWGVIYGAALAGFIYFKTMAMAAGPIALTALIGCSSFVITTLFNAIYWQERLGFFEIAGILLMLTAVLLINYKPTKKDADFKRKGTIRWQIYCLFFFLFSATTGIIFRFHQSIDKANTDEMMILAASLTTLVLIVLFFIKRVMKSKQGIRVEGEKKTVAMRGIGPIIGVALGCGIVSCIYNRLNIFNSGVLPSTLFFPIFNGGVVILSFFSGWIFFKEKPTLIQILGVGIGILAILTVSRFFGLI